MGDRTGIAWTNATWNPTRGCRRVSPGCENCYAERQAIRMSGPCGAYHDLVKLGKNGPRWTGHGRLAPFTLDQPMRWTKPRRIFVDSMSDLFFEEFTNEQIGAVFGVMAAARHHTFQVLTKRPARVLEWFRWANGPFSDQQRRIAAAPNTARAMLDAAHEFGVGKAVLDAAWRGFEEDAWPLPNVWIGVSVEDQARADERTPLLAKVPAAVRFLSVEPLLERVDLTKHLTVGGPDWVIVGGESGPKSRPFDLAWARRIVTDCKAAGVACFVKQMGSVAHDSQRSIVGGWAPGDPEPNTRVRFTGKGADPDEWPEDLRVQEFPL